ncbi:MAG: hypothetical protein M3409_01645, partial [Gemmatimonadota bacterium]|nr:hypothetical protein [Gemmatimonadota bacterium]
MRASIHTCFYMMLQHRHFALLPAALLLAAPIQARQAPAQQQPAAPPSPIARLVVEPANRTVVAGDSVQLRVRALDASGNPVPSVMVRFVPAGGRFEGEVTPTGMVHSGSTGTIPVGITAVAAGTRPVTERVEIRMVPGPAARVEIAPRTSKMAAGQRVRLVGTAYSAGGDRREDRIGWRSSAPGVVRVSEDGLAVAVAPGRAT